MRIVLCHPGAEWSIRDVYVGLQQGLREVTGPEFEMFPYNLAARQERAYKGLQMAYRAVRQKHRVEGTLAQCPPKPTWGDSVYESSWHILHPALRMDCEWVVLVSAMFFHPDAIVMLRRAGRKVAIVFTESPYDDEQQIALARLADMVFTNERTSVEKLRQVCPLCYYLPLAYNPDVHSPEAPLPSGVTVASHDVVMVGTPWPERLAILQAVDWTGIDLGLYGTWSTSLPEGDPLRAYVRGGITDNAVASALYRNAKIGLNWHRTMKGFNIGAFGEAEHVSGAESMNPRCYELAACGCFWISDRREELVEMFGETVPTFRDAKDLQTLIRRWLPDEVGRKRMAAAARARVLPHTWGTRARTLVAALGGSSCLRTSITGPPES